MAPDPELHTYCTMVLAIPLVYRPIVAGKSSRRPRRVSIHGSAMKVEATIVSGGGPFPLKGIIQDTDPRRVTAWLHEQRASVIPYSAPDQRAVFTPDWLSIERPDGTVVAQRDAPRE